MSKYHEALNTSLGDYLNLIATQKGITRKELEKNVQIASINVQKFTLFPIAYPEAVKLFNYHARKYDQVIEMKEGPMWGAFWMVRAMLSY